MTAPAAIAVTPPPVRRGVPWIRVIAGVVIAALALYLPQVNNPENNTIFSQVMYLAVAAMGLNLLTGFNGQISVGHGAHSETTKGTRAAAVDLVWSAGAKVTREERAEVIRKLPPLLKKLRDGMESAGVPGEKRDEHIRACHFLAA